MINLFINVPSKIKCQSLVARDKISLNSDLPSTVSDSLKSSFVQILVVSSKGMLVNKESTSKLPKKTVDQRFLQQNEKSVL